MDIFEAVDAREANGAVFIISQVDYFSFLRVNNVKMLLNCVTETKRNVTRARRDYRSIKWFGWRLVGF